MIGTKRRSVETSRSDPAAIADSYRAQGLFTCDGCHASGGGVVPAAGLWVPRYDGPGVLADFGVPEISVCLAACEACLARLGAGDPAATELYEAMAQAWIGRAYVESIPERN